ncbi:hypothetical protein ACB092_11G049300 [Castanea dentata]
MVHSLARSSDSLTWAVEKCHYPERNYKKGDSKSKMLPKYFQIGMVIESASDFFTGRLTRKEREGTIAAELLSDRTLADYRRDMQLYLVFGLETI